MLHHPLHNARAQSVDPCGGGRLAGRAIGRVRCWQYFAWSSGWYSECRSDDCVGFVCCICTPVLLTDNAIVNPLIKFHKFFRIWWKCHYTSLLANYNLASPICTVFVGEDTKSVRFLLPREEGSRRWNGHRCEVRDGEEIVMMAVGTDQKSAWCRLVQCNLATVPCSSDASSINQVIGWL